jgi:hypothetical protein
MLRNLKDSASKHEIGNVVFDCLKSFSSLPAAFFTALVSYLFGTLDNRKIPYLLTTTPFLNSTGIDFSVLGCSTLGNGTNYSILYTSTTSFSVGAGKVLNSARSVGIIRTATLTKTLDSWASGTGNGSLDTGTIAASTGYSVFAILSTDFSKSDILISLSLNSPTLPTGYSYFRHIGSFVTNSSSQIIPFWQHGNRFIFLAQQVDRAVAVFESTSRITVTVSVPKYMTGIFRVTGSLPTTTTEECFAIVQSTESTNSAASVSNHSLTVGVGNDRTNSEMQIYAGTGGTIAIRGSSTNMALGIATIGFIDTYM